MLRKAASLKYKQGRSLLADVLYRGHSNAHVQGMSFNMKRWEFAMMKLIKNFLTDDSGAAAAEYVLILAIIGTTVAVGVTTLGNAIGTALDDAATEIGTYSYAAP